MVQTLFAQTIWDGTADTTWYTSNKSATEFTITTAEELAGLARLVRGGNDNGTYDMYLQTINLGANIMLNDTADWENWESNPPANEWTAIGTDKNHFIGAFDGNGYEISGVYINSENDYQGLFGYASASNADIRNLGITASYVKGGKLYVGGLIGYLYEKKVINSYFIGTVTGEEDVGGLVGHNSDQYKRGIISGNYFIGTVTGEEDVGGLVGYSRGGSIEKSYSAGTVTGKIYVGGLVGSNVKTVGSDGLIEKSYSTSIVTGTGKEISYKEIRSIVGGLVGYNSGSIEKSYSTGVVTGMGDHVGGLVGNNSGNIEKNYSTGTVTGTGDYVGGLVGKSGTGRLDDVTISNNYYIGMVTGKNYVGGLVGNLDCSGLYNNYSVGNVTGTGSYVGRVVGKIEPLLKGLIYFNYYENQINEGFYYDAGYGRIAEEMKLQETFNNWNFNEIWGIDNAINDGYPYLRELKNSVTPIKRSQIAKNQIVVQATNSGIVLENLPQNAKIQVYNLHGKRIYNSQFSTLNSQFIKVQTKGIYIVKVGTQTFRIAVGQK